MTIENIDNKMCTKCKTEKPLSDFRHRKEMLDGHRSSCRECDVKDSTAYRKKNLEKVKMYSKNYLKLRSKHTAKQKRKWYLKTNYDIGVEDYDSMYIEQGGRCAICGMHQSEIKRSLFVDHCHETEAIRGLLCHKCNLLLGHADDNTEILTNAIKYLGGSNGHD